MGFELANRPGVYAPKIHRGKMLYLSEEVARLADPICRAEIARMEEADAGWARLLRHLADAGPSILEDIEDELGPTGKELKALRAPLERCGAIVARSVVFEPHRHTSVLAHWDQVFAGGATGEPDLGPLVVAGVPSASSWPGGTTFASLRCAIWWAAEREIHRVYVAADADMPSDYPEDAVSFEEWRSETLAHPDLEPDGSFVFLARTRSAGHPKTASDGSIRATT